MNGFSILYFFVVTVMIGTFVDLMVKDWKADWLEKLVMRFGVGLAAMSVIGVILNLLQIPLDYRVFLGIGFLILISVIIKRKSFRSFNPAFIPVTVLHCRNNKSFWYGLFMLLLFAVTVYMYVSGSFNYAYFEDTDPWGYTAVADFIGENRTFSVPYYSIQYSEPYTQGYQIVMGVLSQTNDSIYWTMKFFSALVISFGVLFMYYFARQFSRNEEIALLSGVFLFAVPAWVSHFVFALHYNMTIFVVLLYVLAQLMNEPSKSSSTGESIANKLRQNKFGPDSTVTSGGWVYLGILVYASMLINHFSSVFHASIFCFVFIVTKTLAERKIDWKIFAVFAGGFLLSLLYFIPAFARHWWLTGTKEALGGVNFVIQLATTPVGMIAVTVALLVASLVYLSRNYWQPLTEKWIDVGNRGAILWICGLLVVLVVLLLPMEISRTFGTGDQDYGLKHFFSASSINMMNNPFGLGPVIMSSVLVSFVLAAVMICNMFKPEKAWAAISFGWIITAFLLVLGNHLSLAVAPFRAWTFLGLFASLFAAGGIVILIQSFAGNRWVTIGSIILLTAVLIPTTFMPKFELNTMVWQDHTIGVPGSRKLFEWMRDGGIPKDSVVAHLCGDSEFLSGYDMNPPLWNEAFHPKRQVDKAYFVKNPLELTDEAFTILRRANVEYVTIGASCLWQAPTSAGQEESYGHRIRQLMDQYMADPRLDLVMNTGVELLFRLK